MVSVIIPVYNVEKYLDQCVESVVGQTYDNLEIIMVYDKSSDDSYSHCLRWCDSDARIRLVENPVRRGVGATRNLGLYNAVGKYVLFVDSDDWLDKRYVEILREAMVESGADFVTGSSYYEMRGEEKILRHAMPEGLYKGERKGLLLCTDYITMWKKLYRREWLLENRLFQPEIFNFEDWGTYFAMVIKADAVYASAVPGVYYRALRKGCLTLEQQNLDALNDYRLSLKTALNYLEGHDKNFNNIFVKYFFTKYFFSVKSESAKNSNLQKERLLEAIEMELMIPKFGKVDLWRPNYLVWGSFSLRWELQKGCLIDRKADRHFCFSSLIAAFSEKWEKEVFHTNAFRKRQIAQELASSLEEFIGKADSETFFLLDFMEERFDVLDMGDGIYVTDSEAFRESDLKDISFVRRIQSGSGEHRMLWRRACDRLAEVLRKHIGPKRVILVRNRMSLAYGDFFHREPYENEEELEKINQRLEEMEAYFVGQMPGITILESGPEYCITDDRFNWGCRPEYSNHINYAKIGLQIFEKLFGK